MSLITQLILIRIGPFSVGALFARSLSSLAMSMYEYASTAGKVLFIVWTLKSFIAYHTWSLDQMVADIRTAPLPLNEAGVALFTKLFKAYVDPLQKKDAIQTHMKVSLFLSIALVLQLLQRMRKKAMWIHRNLGRITIAVALLATPGFANLIYNWKTGTAQYVDYLIIFLVPYYGIRGWYQVESFHLFSLDLLFSRLVPGRTHTHI